jgi:hypothetical protein
MTILKQDELVLRKAFGQREAQPYPWRQICTMFNWLQRMEDLNFEAGPMDDCVYRAHLMCRRVMDLGVAPYKAWAFSWYGLKAGETRRLHPKKPDDPPKKGWRDHVTLALPAVLKNGHRNFAILDPVIAERPLTKAQWARALNIRPSQCQICAFGKIPAGAKGDYHPDYTMTTGQEALAYLDDLSRQALEITRKSPRSTGKDLHL